MSWHGGRYPRSMKVKSSTLVWAVVLVLVLGLAGAGGLWFVREQRRKKFREAHQRWEVTKILPLQKTLSEEALAELLESENRRLDRYEVLRPVIDDLNLVGFWGVEGPDEAMAKLQECTEFRKGADLSSVVFFASDKDKEMAAKLGGAVWQSFESMQRRERYLLPSAPSAAE